MSKTGQSLNSVRKISQEPEGQIKGHPNPITASNTAIAKNAKHTMTSVSSIGGYTPNNIIGQTPGMGMGPGRGTNPSGSMNMLKQSKAAGMVELPTGYITSSGHYQQLPSNKSYTKVLKDESSINRNKTGMKCDIKLIVHL